MELICFCLHKYCFIVPPWDQQEQTLIFSHHLKIYYNIPAFSIIMIIYLLLDNHGAAKVKQLSSLILLFLYAIQSLYSRENNYVCFD